MLQYWFWKKGSDVSEHHFLFAKSAVERTFYRLQIHYYLQMLNNSEKIAKFNGYNFTIYMVYQWPHENILKKSVGPRKKIEVKGGRLV